MQKRMHKRTRSDKRNTFVMLLKLSEELRAKTKLAARARKKLFALKMTHSREKRRNAIQENKNAPLAWLRMTAGLIDDADLRVMWEEWQSIKSRFRNNADFRWIRMMPALPTAGTGDALESLCAFYNNLRDEDPTKKTHYLIKSIKRALRQRFTNRCWSEVHGVSQQCIVTLMEHKLAPKEAWSTSNDPDDPHKDLRAQLMKSTYESLENLIPRKVVAKATTPTRASTEKQVTKPVTVATIAYIHASCIEYVTI